MRIRNACVLGVVVGTCLPVDADVLMSNFTAAASPPGTFFGVGSSTFYKAAGFTIGNQAYSLDTIRLSMNFGGGGVGVVSIWQGKGLPQVRIQNLVSPPQTGTGVFTFTPAAPLTLNAATTYWVFVESVSNPTGSFLWDGTTPPTSPSGAAAFAGYIFNGTPSATPNRFEVRGTPVGAACYANCDSSSLQPLLTANDFQCFLSQYAQGLPYANCDNSTEPPVLNANDFLCFLNAFVTGCS
jgi:hypothetical protein